MGFYQDRIVPHLVNLAMRNRQLTPYRERILSQADGRVLEIGVGSGVNLPLYTDRASEVLGLETASQATQDGVCEGRSDRAETVRRIGGINPS